MGVALITPFKSDGSVDYNALVRLVEYQVQNGVDFLCVLGTTAETPTLTEEEKRQIKKVVIERVNGRVPILLGISSNCTQTVLNTLKMKTSQEWMPYWWPFLIIINLRRKAFTSTTRLLPKLQIFR